MFKKVSSEYAPAGTVMWHERPEPPRANPEDDRVTYADMLRAFRWSDVDYEIAKGFKFPDVLGYRIRAGQSSREAFWSRSQITTWRDAFKAFAARVK